MSKFKMLSRKSNSIDFSDLLIAANTSPPNPSRGRKSTTGTGIETIPENCDRSSTKNGSDGMRSRMKWPSFSIRRSGSSSVYDQEKYCRIHDQCIAVLLEEEDEAAQDEDVNILTKKTTMEKEEKHSKILRACKRLLRFH